MRYNIKKLFLVLSILLIFWAWQSIFPPPFVGYTTKHAIFAYNYQQYGVTRNYLLPSYNFALSDPPSSVYLSKPPLIPLIMYIMTEIFGDSPSVYLNTMTCITCLFFVLLAWLIARRWNNKAWLWVLIFGPLSLWALHYGDEQTFEQVAVMGMFASIFLYFEWVETKSSRFIFISVLCYLIGLMADYLAFFSAFVICLHWLFFVRKYPKKDLLLITLYPGITIVLVSLMVGAMYLSNLSLDAWLSRATARAESISFFEIVKSWIGYPILLLGPQTVIASFLFPVVQRRYPMSFVGKRTDKYLILSLLIAGILPLLIFHEAYVSHPFWLIFLIPFFVTTSSLTADICWNNLFSRSVSQKLLPIFMSIFALIIAGNMFFDYLILGQSNANTANQHVQELAESIRYNLVAEDSLLILGNDPVMNDLLRVTLFYTLQIPVQTSTLSNFDLTMTPYTIVLSTSPDSDAIINERYSNIEILAQDNKMSFFRLDFEVRGD